MEINRMPLFVVYSRMPLKNLEYAEYVRVFGTILLFTNV